MQVSHSLAHAFLGKDLLAVSCLLPPSEKELLKGIYAVLWPSALFETGDIIDLCL